MKNLDRRVEWLEEKLGARPGPRLIYLMPNLELDEPDETPHLVKLSSDIWANIYGAPLNADERQALKHEFRSRPTENEQEDGISRGSYFFYSSGI